MKRLVNAAIVELKFPSKDNIKITNKEFTKNAQQCPGLAPAREAAADTGGNKICSLCDPQELSHMGSSVLRDAL